MNSTTIRSRIQKGGPGGSMRHTLVPAVAVGTTHHVYRALLVLAGRGRTAPHVDRRDRGAVSLEQVLWFVAAGVSVAVIASILWTQIRNEAEKPVQAPSSP
ncbi:MAG: hypothetical protein ACO4AY_03610 [Ilumatobacteraceae bacterium]